MTRNNKKELRKKIAEEEREFLLRVCQCFKILN